MTIVETVEAGPRERFRVSRTKREIKDSRKDVRACEIQVAVSEC